MGVKFSFSPPAMVAALVPIVTAPGATFTVAEAVPDALSPAFAIYLTAFAPIVPVAEPPLAVSDLT